MSLIMSVKSLSASQQHKKHSLRIGLYLSFVSVCGCAYLISSWRREKAEVRISQCEAGVEMKCLAHILLHLKVTKFDDI